MALSSEQWLQTHFFPVVDSLPATPEAADPSSPLTAVAVIAAMRLSGAVDALTTTGVLDAEQQERCRAALASKGVTSTKVVSSSSVALVSGLVASHRSHREREPEPEPEQGPDRLVRVLGDGRVFGLVEGEQAVLIAVEVWERSVHADFLIAVDPAAQDARDERAKLMRDWLQKKQAGEASDADRPAMSMAMNHPGAATTWLLEAGDRSAEGRMASGQGGQDWWRLRVQWDIEVGRSAELVITGTEAGRVIGRTTLTW